MDEDSDPTGDGGNIDVGGGVIMGQGGVDLGGISSWGCNSRTG